MGEVSEDKSYADQVNTGWFQPGIGADQTTRRYDDWSKSYDKIMSVSVYHGPQLGVEEILRQVPAQQRAACRVLDVGAGTGQVGSMLAHQGFKLLDAVEPSIGMLQILREKKAYRNTYEVYLGCGDTTLPEETYDVTVCVGGMGENHLPLSSLDDMIKVTKPGGLVVIVMREEYLVTVEAYRDKLEPYWDSLEERGLWTRITRKVVPKYFCDKEGLILTYRVC